jgi:hypothetical protein
MLLIADIKNRLPNTLHSSLPPVYQMEVFKIYAFKNYILAECDGTHL